MQTGGMAHATNLAVEAGVSEGVHNVGAMHPSSQDHLHGSSFRGALDELVLFCTYDLQSPPGTETEGQASYSAHLKSK